MTWDTIKGACLSLTYKWNLLKLFNYTSILNIYSYKLKQMLYIEHIIVFTMYNLITENIPPLLSTYFSVH